MKKYKQLLLIIISVVSFSLLLIYRHEYNRLRYVLEVFNFFGDPNQCNFLEILNATTTTTEEDWGPVPTWLTISDNTYIYSAFLHSENDIEAIVIDYNNKNFIKYCYLWFERKINAVMGKLKYSKIDQIDNHQLALYKYYCHVNFGTKAPYAVSLTNKNKRTKGLKKVFLQSLNKPNLHVTTICVMPYNTYSESNVIEFISYHNIVGVNTFIIYNNNIPHYQMQLLKKLCKKLGIRLISYPWNYPGTVTTTGLRKIIKEDCLLRTKELSKNVAILDWSEFIVPRYHHTVESIINQADPTNHTHQFSLKVLVFCVTNHNPWEPAILRNIFFDEGKPVESLFIYRNDLPQTNIINTQAITANVAAIHRYIQCASHPAHSKQEDAMLRFTSELRKSILFNLFKDGKL